MANSVRLSRQARPGIEPGTSRLQVLRAELPRHWWSSSVLKTGMLEVPGSIPGSAFLSSRLKFSVVFSEIRVNTG